MAECRETALCLSICILSDNRYSYLNLEAIPMLSRAKYDQLQAMRSDTLHHVRSHSETAHSYQSEALM